MLYILVDDKYKNTYTWNERLVLIRNEARKKRYDFLEIESLSEIPVTDPSPVVLLRSASQFWITDNVEQANQRQIYPVVMANLPPNHGLRCSWITADMAQDTKLAIEYLHSCGKKSLALFGINPAPYSDTYRASIFSEYLCSETGLYYMNDSFKAAYQTFYRDIDLYDGIIVCNTATAVALTILLKEHLSIHTHIPYIVAFGELQLMNYFSSSITTISNRIDNIGQIVFSLYKMITKYKDISNVSISLESVLYPRATTEFRQPEHLNLTIRQYSPCYHNPYLESTQISEIMQVESMLQKCDQTDLDLLFGLQQGKSCPQLAEQCFLSVTAVQYRIKKLEKICNQKSLRAFRHLLQKYLSANN